MSDLQSEGILVRFVPKPGVATSLDIPETQIGVPAVSTRKTLAEILNGLGNCVPPRNFKFWIDSKLVKGTLKSIVEKKNISEEDTVMIEYAESKPKPVPDIVCEQDDWVSSLAIDHTSAGLDFALTGGYDGSVRLWNLDVEAKETKDADPMRIRTQPGVLVGSHAGVNALPVKGIAWIPKSPHLADYQGRSYAVCASKDHTLRSYLIDKISGIIQPVVVYDSHGDSVECVAASPTPSPSSAATEVPKFCSGSWDGDVSVWFVRRSDGDGDGSVQAKKRRKKSKGKGKGEGEVEVEKAPIVTLRGHSQCVSSVRWVDIRHVWSGSWDHSIKQWDVEKGMNALSLASSKAASVISCISVTSDETTVVSGHSDRIIRLWDAKSESGVTVSGEMQGQGHKGWVTGVVHRPDDESKVASIGHDGVVNVWDVRKPESVLWSAGEVHSDKGLCVDWVRGDGDGGVWYLASGGADKRLVVTKYQ